MAEWRRERGLRAIKASTLENKESGPSADVADMMATRPTTIERQHWFLTDMIFFLYHTVCTFHVIVPILYWGYLSVSGEAHMMAVDISTEPKWRNYSFHGGDLILVLIEFSINAMPFIPSHIIIVFFICLLYLGEAMLVHRVDGFWIYPFLDTSVGPIWVAMYLGVGFAIACAFVVMYFMHRARNWVITRRAAARALDSIASSSSSSAHGASAVPEMVVVSSSVPVTNQALYNTLPTGTVLVATDYDLSNSSNHHHHHSIFTHTNTSTAIFPTAAPPTTILTTTQTATPSSSSIQPTPSQPLSIPTQILIQSRRRSYSNCSNDSTTSTLVGAEEGIMSYKKDQESTDISERTARRLSMTLPTPYSAQDQEGNTLEKVEEEEDYETDVDQ
ncbi:hypothetical protein EC991_002066 [Linnemannia zychae]|nr:hypothetical protein EC991_002066 [Linnemannia zychae]